MKSCKKCGRPLIEGENDLCPACKSDKSYKIKKVLEIIGIGMGIAGLNGIAVTLKKFLKR